MRASCSIVIPVYNQVESTRRCLDTILSEPPAVPFEIVVVDDASTDSTPRVLSQYGSRIRAVSRETNGGFANATNDGVSVSAGEYLILLNNDTVPHEGWLDKLVAYAESHPRAAVIGAKLLFPDDTIQHAGVVIAPPCNPYHIYSGYPADHPPVNRSRRFQCVTFACALIRRAVFEELGGLDSSYDNSFEDVEFCFQLGQRGHEVHYCHESVLYHLESVSRGKRSEDTEHNVRLLHSRWRGRVECDDLKYYLEDRQWGGTPSWVYGRFADGWVARNFRMEFQGSRPVRRLLLEISVPPDLGSDQVLEIDTGDWTGTEELRPGENRVLKIPITVDTGQKLEVEIRASATWSPGGADTRELAYRIVDAVLESDHRSRQRLTWSESSPHAELSAAEVPARESGLGASN